MNEATQRSRLVEGQYEQVAERRFINAAVVTERKLSHAAIYDCTGGIRPNHQKLIIDESVELVSYVILSVFKEFASG